jgi:hypothetical protein
MSILELKKTADNLTAKERKWLRNYLFVSERSSTTEWKRVISGKKKQLIAGMGVSDSTYKRRMAKGTQT